MTEQDFAEMHRVALEKLKEPPFAMYLWAIERHPRIALSQVKVHHLKRSLGEFLCLWESHLPAADKNTLRSAILSWVACGPDSQAIGRVRRSVNAAYIDGQARWSDLIALDAAVTGDERERLDEQYKDELSKLCSLLAKSPCCALSREHLDEFRKTHSPQEVGTAAATNRWQLDWLTPEERVVCDALREEAEARRLAVEAKRRERKEMRREAKARRQEAEARRQEAARAEQNRRRLEKEAASTAARNAKIEELNRFRQTATPFEVACRVTGTPYWENIPLTDEETACLKAAKAAERAKRAKENHRNAMIWEIDAYRSRNSPEEFAVKFATSPQWHTYATLSPEEEALVEQAKIEKPLAISHQKAAGLLSVSVEQIALWSRWGWLASPKLYPKKIDSSKLPDARQVKALIKKESKMPPSARATGDWCQAEVLARGWRKSEIDLWLGEPDEVRHKRHGVVIYLFLQSRVLRCEEGRAKMLQAFKREVAKRGGAVPETVAKIEDAVKFAINKLPHLHKIKPKLVGDGWKISKAYAVAGIKVERVAVVPCKGRVTTWKDLVEIGKSVNRKQQAQIAVWDAEFAGIQKLIKGHLDNGLLPEILAQAIKQIGAKDWAGSGLEKKLDLVIKKAAMSHILSLSNFHDTFDARKANRELTAILGPTNSGKTHEAFEQLRNAKTGVYLAPLRLMAAEGWDKLSQAGVCCSLLTGEEQRLSPGDTHISATVEMLPVDQQFDVAVIDEVQMLADPDRGWAWTNAILGVNAKRVFLVGAPQAEAVLSKIADVTKEPLTVVHKERFTPLSVVPPIGSAEQAPKASAIISFSRSSVLQTKASLGAKCGVIYGALSPEVRREEARRFAAQESTRLAATDAIGMGLNLPIQTIIFSQVEKWDGQKRRPLTATEVQQIAGRAGRFGHFEEGRVTAFRAADVDFLAKRLNEVIAPLPQRMQIGPHLHMLETISSKTGIRHLSGLLAMFKELHMAGRLYHKAGLQAISALADWLKDRAGALSLKTQFHLCCCPIDTRSQRQIDVWAFWVKKVRGGLSCELPAIPKDIEATDAGLSQAEDAVSLLNTYKWLHFKMPDLFPYADEAGAQTQSLNARISEILRGQVRRTCRECGTTIYSYHAMCDRCFRGFNAAMYGHEDFDDEDEDEDEYHKKRKRR